VAEKLANRPLLVTKLTIPRIHTDILQRQRLLDLLQESDRLKLTLITAPAGFGKTTLAQLWAKSMDCPVTWFAIDSGDNDPKRFWTYFIAALQAVKPEIGSGAQESLLNPAAGQELGLTILINEFAELDNPLTLVLDDYHEIESPEIQSGMSFLIDNLPEQLHIIIASRSEPDLPLPRLRARRQMLEVTAADLRFTNQEITDFLQNLFGLQLATKQIESLANRTEGWVAGLQMAALSMQNQDDLDGFIRAFTGSHHHILDYLVEEVLEQQSDNVQLFLLQTSILNGLCAEICEAVTQQIDAQTILDELSQRNLFITPLDDERKWFRYHQLFAEFLRNRLHRRYPDMVSQLHARAALWFIKRKMFPEAVEQLIEGKRYEDAADLIEEHGSHIFWRYHEWVRLHNWLDALPRDLVHGRPTLCAAYGWTYLLAGQHDQLSYYLDAADAALSIEHDNDTIGEIIALKAEYAMLEGDFDSALELAADALSYLSEDNLIIRSVGLQIQGYIYRNMGNVREASRYLTGAHHTSLRAGELMIGVFALSDLGNVNVLQGRLNDAFDIYENIIRTSGSAHSANPISAMLGLGDIWRERNQLEKAIEYLENGIELSQQYNISTVTRNGHVLLSYALFAHGDIDEAMRAIDFAVQSAHRSGIDRIATQARAHQMNLLIRQNKLAYAEEWISSRQLSIDEEVSYVRELELVVFARLLIAEQKYNDAINLLSRIVANAELDGRSGNAIEDLVLLALAYEKSEDTENALSHLERAVELAVSENYIRVFVDGGTVIAKLLRLLASDSQYTNYLSRILDTFEETPPETVRIEGELIEDLSDREMEVLRLLAVGMSNREIADQLIIGNSTVKTHTLNIYRKLSVKNRTQAVTRARNLNLI